MFEGFSLPPEVIAPMLGQFTEAIESMSKDHPEAKGNPVTIVARRAPMKHEDGSVTNEPEVRFCYLDSGTNTFVTYRKYDKNYLDSDISMEERMKIQALSSLIITYVDQLEAEKGEPVIITVFNQKSGFMNNTSISTIVQMQTLSGEILSKLPITEALSHLKK